MIDLTTSATTTSQGATFEALCNGPEIDDEAECKEVASQLMGMLAKQPFLLDAMQQEMAAKVAKQEMQSFKNTQNYYLCQYLECEETQMDLVYWAREQFVESGQADEAKELAKREVREQVEREIRASAPKMAGIERGLKRKLEREIRADPAKLARVHQTIRIRELVPDVVRAVRGALEGMDEEE